MLLFQIFHKGNCHTQCCIIFWRPMSIHNFRALLYMSKYCIPYGYKVTDIYYNCQLPFNTHILSRIIQHTHSGICKEPSSVSPHLASVIHVLSKNCYYTTGPLQCPLSKPYTIWVLKTENRKLTVTAKLQFQEPTILHLPCYS
jgi:hypothetical protein